MSLLIGPVAGLRGVGLVVRLVSLLILLMASASAFAQAAKQPYEEYDKLIKGRKAIATLGPQLFGDSVDLYTGALSFSNTDISVPGNNALPVAVTRKFVVRDDQGNGTNNSFADWEIDIPNIGGLFTIQKGWHDNRCDVAQPQPAAVSGGSPIVWADFVDGSLYWKGDTASMPGGGELLAIDAATPKPSTGGPYKWITPGRVVLSCLPSLHTGSGTGQGFFAIAPDGTKYWFDWMAQNRDAGYSYTTQIGLDQSGNAMYGTAELQRNRIALYATRVEDRFGNWVTYTYTNASNQPIHLTAINSSDGRSVTVHYNASNLIDSISSSVGTWTYQYDSNSFHLTGVTQPDAGNGRSHFRPSRRPISVTCPAPTPTIEPASETPRWIPSTPAPTPERSPIPPAQLAVSRCRRWCTAGPMSPPSASITFPRPVATTIRPTITRSCRSTGLRSR